MAQVSAKRIDFIQNPTPRDTRGRFTEMVSDAMKEGQPPSSIRLSTKEVANMTHLGFDHHKRWPWRRPKLNASMTSPILPSSVSQPAPRQIRSRLQNLKSSGIARTPSSWPRPSSKNSIVSINWRTTVSAPAPNKQTQRQPSH